MNSRLGIVCRSLVPDAGGRESYMLSLIDGLVDRGFELLLVSEEARPGLDDHPGIDVRTLSPFKVEQGVRKWLFCRRAQSIVQSQVHLDLVITTGHVDFGGLYIANGGSHRAYLRRCGSWSSWLRPKNWIQLYLQDRLFTGPGRTFLTHSKMARDDIVREHGTNPDRILTICHGIDTDRFHPDRLDDKRAPMRERLGYGPEDFVLLFTGGSWKRKGLPHVLKALKGVDQPRTKLLVVGETKYRRAKRFARRLGISKRVRFQGYVDHIEKYYALSDALCFPSRHDQAGLVVLEALASGLPVITTRTTGMHELIENGENGFVIETADDEETLARRMKQLSNAPGSRYESMCEHAARTGRQYPFERHLSRFVQLVDDLAH